MLIVIGDILQNWLSACASAYKIGATDVFLQLRDAGKQFG
jgi:hypothetical protein